MIAGFRRAVERTLPFEEKLTQFLANQKARDWQPIADVFATRLPEFDGIVALPSSALLAQQVASARGVPCVLAQQDPKQGWTLPPLSETASVHGQHKEFIILTDHLQDGFAEVELLEAATQQGVSITLVGAAVERTNLGARNRLMALGAQVKAVMQIADTPTGLVFERRSPNRWMLEGDKDGPDESDADDDAGHAQGDDS